MQMTFSIRGKSSIKWGLAASAVLLLFVAGCHADPSPDSTIYDSNPNHLWNRLNQALFERTASDGKNFGLDELDILYWQNTTNLLIEPSHRRALAVMDEFINTHGEKQISDPLKRALLQRDLWELFDWSTRHIQRPDQTHRSFTKNYPSATKELQLRLATLIRRLALTTNEIATLPDNYAQADAKGLPDLPHDLFNTNGDWISVGRVYDEPSATAHATAFEGHSAFIVMLHHPDGRRAATNYLDQLRSFKETWLYGANLTSHPDDPNPPILNPKLPQFPANTEWALVRRMCVIDRDGRIRATPLIESIQSRRYLEVQPLKNRPPSIADEQISVASQGFAEFQMDRTRGAALQFIAAGEKHFEFVHFQGPGIDPFEARYQGISDSSTLKTEVLGTCGQCHGAPGLGSVNTFTRLFSSGPSFFPIPLREISPEWEIAETVRWKERQYSWGLLQGLWLKED